MCSLAKCLLFIDTPHPPMVLQNKTNKKWNLENFRAREAMEGGPWVIEVKGAFSLVKASIGRKS